MTWIYIALVKIPKALYIDHHYSFTTQLHTVSRKLHEPPQLLFRGQIEASPSVHHSTSTHTYVGQCRWSVLPTQRWTGIERDLNCGYWTIRCIFWATAALEERSLVEKHPDRLMVCFACRMLSSLNKPMNMMVDEVLGFGCAGHHS